MKPDISSLSLALETITLAISFTVIAASFVALGEQSTNLIEPIAAELGEKSQ